METKLPVRPDASILLDLLAVFPRLHLDWLADIIPGMPPGLAGEITSLHEIRREGGWLEMDAQAADSRLRTLEAEDLPRYYTLHHTTLEILEPHLQDGQSEVETSYLVVFERLANRLLLDDPPAFVQLVDETATVPLTSSAGKQQREYFQGLALVKSDRYAEAILVFNHLLDQPDLADEIRGRALNSRANCYLFAGNFEPAIRDYRLALELWRRLDNPLRQGIALLNLGITCYDLQDYSQAQASLEEAADLFIAAGSNQWLASARNELGLVYRDLGQWELSRQNLRAAADQRRKDGAIDSLGAALNNLAEVLLLQGRITDAEEQLQEAIQLMSTRLWAIEAHLNLGLIYQISERIEAAVVEYEHALELSESVGRRDNLALIHYRLGEALRRRGETGPALERFRMSAEIVENSRRWVSDEGLKISLLGRWQQTFEALVLLCLETGRTDEAFIWAERSRARAFAEAVAIHRSIPELDDSDNGRISGEIGVEPIQTSSEVTGISEENSPLLAPISSISALQSMLPAGTAVLSYFTTGVLDRESPMLRALPVDGPIAEHMLIPGRTILFWITDDSFSIQECPLDPNLLSYRSMRVEDGSRFTSPAVLDRLQTALLPKALSASPGSTIEYHKVIVIPHGPLHRVPFRAFPLLREGPPIAFSPSVTMLQHFLAHELDSQNASGVPQGGIGGDTSLAIGFDGTEEQQRLRHSEIEARWIAQIHHGEAWVGPERKKERLQRTAINFRHIHFACHGWFDEQSPLDSYLETGWDEQLTAREVIETWKLHADLIVLSACRTGNSRILRSDEPLGLVRAFLIAGARHVLGSLWSADDLPTFLIMRFFYDELEHPDIKPAQALFNAQLRLAELRENEIEIWMTGVGNSADQSLPIPASSLYSKKTGGASEAIHPFSDPFYWAGFILVEG